MSFPAHAKRENYLMASTDLSLREHLSLPIGRNVTSMTKRTRFTFFRSDKGLRVAHTGTIVRMLVNIIELFCLTTESDFAGSD